MQAKSIDFYGAIDIDEGICEDTVELQGQVDFHNTWQDHDSRFTTFDPLQDREIGEVPKKKKRKIQRSKWRDKSECNSCNNGSWLNVTGWEQQPLNFWYPYVTDEIVWNTTIPSCHC